MKLSVIIPVYNGAETIGALIQGLEKELKEKVELEFVLINDASPNDNSAEVCRGIAQKAQYVRFLDLSRNFGEHNAVMAGLNYCSGDAAVILDDDFQNPPSEVIKLVDELEKGYDVVYSRYERKYHSLFRNLGSSLNNMVSTVLLDKPRDLYLSSFKIINRFVIDRLVEYNGAHPYIDGFILRVTRNYSTVTVQHDPRLRGKSGYTLRKLSSLWMNMFTNFSILPLRLAMVLGFIFALSALVVAVVFAIEKLRNPDLPAGWASIIVTMLVIGAVQLFAIGMVGEYLGRLFLKETGNPQFVVRNSVNCDEKDYAGKKS